MTNARLFLAIGAVAFGVGGALWYARHAARAPELEPPGISAPALLATGFRDAQGAPATLGQFPGKVLVVNFWATWCGPCRAEMPAFQSLQRRWGDRGVQFIGLSAETPETVARFGAEIGIAYPLWTGGGQVSELSRRLGNRMSVLPHTVILSAKGEILEQRVGPYTEAELEALLSRLATKST